MTRTNRINFLFFSFLFALEKHLNKNLPAGVGGNGEWVTVLPAWCVGLVSAWKGCRSARGMFQQGNQGMGNKGHFYTALFARIWEYRGEAVAAFQGGAGICSFPNFFSFPSLFFFLLFRPELQEHSTGSSQKLLHCHFFWREKTSRLIL